MWAWPASGAWPGLQSLQGNGGGALTDVSSAGDNECVPCDGDVPWPRKSALTGVAKSRVAGAACASETQPVRQSATGTIWRGHAAGGGTPDCWRNLLEGNAEADLPDLPLG